MALGVKSSLNAGDIRDMDLIPELERSLEKEMATHSSILTWRIPWRVEPGTLQSMGLQRVRHNWSNLAHTYIHACTLMQLFNFRKKKACHFTNFMSEFKVSLKVNSKIHLSHKICTSPEYFCWFYFSPNPKCIYCICCLSTPFLSIDSVCTAAGFIGNHSECKQQCTFYSGILSCRDDFYFQSVTQVTAWFPSWPQSGSQQLPSPNAVSLPSCMKKQHCWFSLWLELLR